MKSLLPVILPVIVLFIAGCKKSTIETPPSLNGGCLLAKKTKLSDTDKMSEETIYTYNSKQQIASIKYTFSSVDGTSTFTEAYHYNSDGQVTKIVSDNSTYSYVYKNRLLIEKKYEQSSYVSLSQYFYNADSRKTKLIYKNSTGNTVSEHFENTYEYQDTLLVRIKNRSLIAEQQIYDNDLVYQYDTQHRLIEEQSIDTAGIKFSGIKYEYDPAGNITKKIHSNGSRVVRETVFVYNDNRQVEETEYSVNDKGERSIFYKITFVYLQDNLSKKSTFYNGTLSYYEQYTYNCGK